MPTLSFNGLLIVGLVAVAVPLLLQLAPALLVPALVLEIIGGVIVGPAGFGWVHVDPTIRVLSDLGLGLLLFVAGYEIDTERFRGRAVRLALVAFCGSAVLALTLAYLAALGGAITTPLLVGIALMSTSLGLLVPLLKDAGEAGTDLGQLVITAGSIAEFVPIVLLSLFFSATSRAPVVQTALLGGFALVVLAAGAGLLRLGQLPWLTAVLRRLDDTSSQLRIRVAMTMALGFGVAAERFGLSMIMGSFLAGVIVRMIMMHDPDMHPPFVTKLDAISFGFLIPIFFVATGIDLDVRTLVTSPAAMAKVPMFLLAFLIVRGAPALVYRRILTGSRVAVAGLLQATTLTILIVTVQIGARVGKMAPSTGVALLTAGLLSVVLFPPAALSLLTKSRKVQPVHYERFG